MLRQLVHRLTQVMIMNKREFLKQNIETTLIPQSEKWIYQMAPCTRSGAVSPSLRSYHYRDLSGSITG
eukprot:5791306-Pyramimonas_sp.AAC.1